jgi:DNA-binding beta-propeller fold protein YncE
MVYASNFNADRITVYAPGARGDAAPVRAIEGDRTQLAGPQGLVVDACGRLYVANRRAATVTVYAPGATGNIQPLRTLRAPGMRSAQGLALAPDGNLFVSSWPAGDGSGTAAVVHFAEGARCDYTIAGTRTGLTYPVGLAVADDGTLYAANAFGGVVAAYAAGAQGNAAPLRTFTAATASTQGIACGARTLLVSGACVFLYPAGAGPGTPPAAVLARSMLLPLRCAAGVAIDESKQPPVVCVADSAGALHVIRMSGVAPALRVASVDTIAGPATRLHGPAGIFLAIA